MDANIGLILFIIIITLIIFIIYKNKKNNNFVKNIHVKKLDKIKTFTEIFIKNSKKYKNIKALKIKSNKKKWKTITYGNYFKQCYQFSQSINTVMNDNNYNSNNSNNNSCKVCIIGSNAPEWLYAYLGTMINGGISIGIYKTAQRSNIKYIIESIKPDILVVENAEQLRKFFHTVTINKRKYAKLIGNSIKAIVSYSRTINNNLNTKVPIYSWNEFLEIGKTNSNNQIMPSSGSNDIATIIFTSGTTSTASPTKTTGKPKGVMITHKNILSMIKSIMIMMIRTNMAIEFKKERFTSYLPLNHIAAQIMDIYLPILIGGCVWVADGDVLSGKFLKFKNVLKSASPTIFAGVPRVWEKLMESIERNKNKILFPYKLGMSAASNFTNYFDRKIIDDIGLECCKYAITTAAPLSNDVKEYFKDMGLYLYDVYGMSETCGIITASNRLYNKIGSVGRVLPNINIKISKKNGEILVRGDSITSGYYQDNDNTIKLFKIIASKKKKLKWLKTGDKGYIDNNGYLFITGRIKDLIITAGGENVMPTEIEERIKSYIPIVDQAIVIGDKKKFLSVLLTLKLQIGSNDEQTVIFTQEARDILKSIGSKSKNIYGIDNDKILKKYINDGINDVNIEASSNVHKIKKWIIIPKSFTVKGGELTPTMKLQRNKIYKKYKKYIDEIYKK